MEVESGPGQSDKVVIERKITLLSGVTIIVGTIIGSGIFVSPTGVFVYTESLATSLIVWCLSGVVSTLGALCYAELGTLITRSGGDYAYLLVSSGPFLAFLCLWVTFIIIRPTILAICAITFATYAIKPFFPDCNPPIEAVRMIAASSLLFLTAVNCLSTSWALKVQNVFTAAKLLALISIILVGGYHMATGNVQHFDNPWDGKYDLASISLATFSGLYAFGGWNILNFVTEELQNPYKNLPRAIWIAMPIVTIVYVLVNMAYFAVLSKSEMLSSFATAVLFGHKMFGPVAWVIPMFVAISTFGGINGVIFTSARLFAIGAEEKHFPSIFALVHLRKKTLIPSLLILCGISILMLWSDIFYLINLSSHAYWLCITACIIALLWLRKAEPDLHRPIKVNIVVPIIFLVFCLFLVLTPLFTEFWNFLFGLVLTFSGIPIYLICIHWKRYTGKFFGGIAEFLQDFCQKFFITTFPDKQD